MLAEEVLARATAGWQSIEIMSAETAILRAYALACQCRYFEAERELKSVPETLDSAYGIDLYARILWAGGQRSAARRLWGELVCTHPDFEPAAKALSADDDALKFKCERSGWLSRRCLYAVSALAAVMIGVAFSIGKFCGSSVEASSARPKVIGETILHGRFGGAELRALRDGILTNLTDETMLVIQGGSGKQITDRQRRLAVVADCIREITGTPVSKMYFRPSEVSSNDVILQIVPAYSSQEGQQR